MHQVRGELDDVVEIATDTCQNRLQVVEHLLELHIEITDAGDAAINGDRELTRHEKERAFRYLADVRVETLGWTGAGWIEVFDRFAHCRLLSDHSTNRPVPEASSYS